VRLEQGSVQRPVGRAAAPQDPARGGEARAFGIGGPQDQAEILLRDAGDFVVPDEMVQIGQVVSHAHAGYQVEGHVPAVSSSVVASPTADRRCPGLSVPPTGCGKPVRTVALPEVARAPRAPPAPSAGPVPTRDLNLRVPDSDARAVAYVAGAAPNKWGIMADGKPAIATGPDAFADGDKEAAKGPSGLMAKWRQAFSSSPAVPGFRSEGHRVYQSHPLFPVVTLQLLQEVLNRRLFSTVRERKRLTYDANMHLTSFERMAGGWYLVTVTAKPELAQQALDACKETLEAARTWDPISRDNLQSAAFELCSKHAGAMQTNRYWVDLMSGLQLGVMPDKDERYIADFIPIVQAIQVHDLQAMLACLATEEGQERWTCIGISGGDQPVDEAGHSAPSLSRR